MFRRVTILFLIAFLSSAHPAGAVEFGTLANSIRPAVVTLKILDADRQEFADWSGVFISPRQIATNYHFLREAHAIVAVLADGKEYEIKTIDGDDLPNDLVILGLAENVGPTAPKISKKIPSPGDQVAVVGPDQSIESGIVLRDHHKDYPSFWRITANVETPCAGSPIINSAGEVVGIARADMDNQGRNTSFLIPIAHLSTIDLTHPVAFTDFTAGVLNQQETNALSHATGILVDAMTQSFRSFTRTAYDRKIVDDANRELQTKVADLRQHRKGGLVLADGIAKVDLGEFDLEPFTPASQQMVAALAELRPWVFKTRSPSLLRLMVSIYDAVAPDLADEQSLAYWRALAEVDQGDSIARYLLADKSLQLKLYSQAEWQLATLPQIDGRWLKSPQWHMKMASCLAGVGDKQQALKQCGLALNMLRQANTLFNQVDSDRMSFEAAEIYFLCDRFDDARTILLRLENEGYGWRTESLLGQIYARTNQSDLANEELAKMRQTLKALHAQSQSHAGPAGITREMHELEAAVAQLAKLCDSPKA